MLETDTALSTGYHFHSLWQSTSRPKFGQCAIKLKLSELQVGVGEVSKGWRQNCVTWIPSQFEQGKEAAWGTKQERGKEYRRKWFQQELCLSVSSTGSQQGHYLAPNLSSGTALKGCLCLGLMRKAQDAMSEGTNQRGPFITLAACAPGQGPAAHFCGDEIYDKPLSEAKSRQQSSNTHRPPGILWPP